MTESFQKESFHPKSSHPESTQTAGADSGSPRILIVDDDPHIREVIRFALQKAGFVTDEAVNGRDALDRFESSRPDLLVLDILMPEMDGTEVCRRIRYRGPSKGSSDRDPTDRVPIIFLSSKSDEIDRVLGLELGGDDYVTKPFSPRELVARVRAVLRRVAPQPSSSSPSVSTAGPIGAAAGSGGGSNNTQAVLAHGALRLDPDRFEATWNGEIVPLTVTEFGLLQALMGRPGKVFTRDELMQLAYRDHVVVSDRTINSHIKRLRRKLSKAGAEPIETVHGLGYRLSC